MIERPILFNGPMVRALLDGSKTQTRRVAKVRNELPPAWATVASEGHSLSQDAGPRPTGCFFWSEDQTPGMPLKALRRWPILPANHPMAGDWYWTPSPYGKIGDRLWVRETFLYVGPGSGSDLPSYREERANPENHKASNCWFRASQPDETLVWTQSIHMPRWASRITLEVTGVRVERLQDISEADAQAEGVGLSDDQTYPYTFAFATLWDQLNGDDAWSADPWVWVVEFKRVAPAVA